MDTGLFEESSKIVHELIPTTLTKEALFIHLLLKAIRIKSRESYDLIFNKFGVVINAGFVEVLIIEKIVILLSGCEIFWIKGEILTILGIELNVELILLMIYTINIIVTERPITFDLQ